MIHRIKAIEEVSEYTKEPGQVVLMKMEQAQFVLNEEWNKLNPKTEQERNEFYKNTDWYIYDLMSWGRPRWEKKILKHLEKLKYSSQNGCCNVGDIRVLDYGCGTGDFTIACSENGYNVNYVDVPDSKTLKFTEWRLNKRGLESKKETGFYNAIICFDVMEHMEDPIKLLNDLTRTLNNQGLLFLNVGFHDMRPMHISHDEKSFRIALNEIFELVEDGRMQVWRKK
jgi:SAM-dependent methyltransferase